MRKKFTILLVLTFALGLTPINFTEAITQNQISAEVQIVCPDNYGNWFSGSGTIIDSKGIILTNKHVVTDQYGGIIKTCFIGFTESISQEPNFGTQTNPNLAEVKYYTSTNDMDTAILYLNNPTNKNYTYVDIWNSNSNTLQFGHKIEAIGFPSIGGSTITYTSGDFSGFGSASDGTQNYIKATTPLEHGNSGGAAYNPAGQFIGIPTMVVAGTLNSLSYILSVNSIKSWLSGILGNNYQQEVIEQKPVIETPNVSIQNDVTPPQLKGFNIEYQIVNDRNLKKSYIRYSIPKNKIIENGTVEKIYYYFGDNEFADPLSVGKSFKPDSSQNIEIPDKFLLTSSHLYFIIKLQDDSGNISSSIVAPWDIAAMLKIGAEEFLYNQALANFTSNSQTILQKYSGLFVKNNGAIWWVSPKDKVRFLVYDPSLETNFALQSISSWYRSSFQGYVMNTGITTSDLAKKPKNVWGHLLFKWKDDGTGAGDGDIFYYIHPQTGKLYILDQYISWPYVDVTTSSGLELLNFINSIAANIPTDELNHIEPLGTETYMYRTLQYNRDNNLLPLYGFATPAVPDQQEADTTQSSSLVNRLKGKILLQVEAHGEAYYVYPNDSKRYYMANGNEAYRIMRYLGVGITDADLNKVKTNKNFAKQHSGKIFLQVEAHGEAFYIDFDGNAHYLKDGSAAYAIMRELGLGITNNDLRKIPEGNL
jgi:hypothetical protein